MTTISITVLVDNHVQPGLSAEHGLSIWIETPSGRLLFDSGQGEALERNVNALGIPVEDADAIVLSHGHYDHTGGLPFVLEKNTRAPIVLHPGAFVERFSIRDRQARANGMVSEVRLLLKKNEKRLRLTDTPSEPLPGLHVTGFIPRLTSFEDVGGPFFLDKQGLLPDTLPDDQAVWIEHPDGTVVVLGCGHAGVINTCEYIRKLTGGAPIQTVIGGFHLGSASLSRLERTVQELLRLKVKLIVPCHCTGEEAVRFMQRRMPDRIRECAAGQVVTINVKK